MKINTLVCSFLLLGIINTTHANEDIQVLVDELEAIAEKSRQQRAADRWLQLALEDLVAKYNFPWRNSILSDDFSDGNYTDGIAWQVGSGEFWVDRRLGLRSNVIAKEKPSERTPATTQNEQQDLGRVLLGALLEEALGTQEQQASSTEQKPQKVTIPASIRSKITIPTTFAVESRFSQNNRPGIEGQFEWMVIQDDSADNGYKVQISSGNKTLLDIIRIRGGRTSYLDTKEIKAINDGDEHSLSWRQTSDGEITLLLDGNEVISTMDRPFRNGFNYIGMINRKGDFSVSSIDVLAGK